MKLLIDVILAVIIIAFTITSYKKGFIKTLVSGCKNIIAFVVAIVFNSALSKWLNENYFLDSVTKFIEEKFEGFLGNGAAETTDIAPLIDTNHKGFFAFIEKMGISVEEINELFRNADGTVSEAVNEYVAAPLGNVISSIVAFILLFIAARIALFVLEKILGAVAKLPVIKTANRLLGGILGLIMGVFFALIVTAFIKAIVPYVSDELVLSTLNEGNTLYNFLRSISPMFLPWL